MRSLRGEGGGGVKVKSAYEPGCQSGWCLVVA